MTCCVVLRLWDQHLKEDVRHCNLLHFSNHANSYNPSQNFLWQIWKCRHIFWVVKKLQLLEEAIPLNIHWVHCLRYLGPPYAIQCIYIGQNWKTLNGVFIKILNCILNSFFLFFPFKFSMPKRIGFWKINHKSKTYWLLRFIGGKNVKSFQKVQNGWSLFVCDLKL